MCFKKSKLILNMKEIGIARIHILIFTGPRQATKHEYMFFWLPGPKNVQNMNAITIKKRFFLFANHLATYLIIIPLSIQCVIAQLLPIYFFIIENLV